uniref:Uncharacterized protein n=1 Tax=Anguilla anguilla TaxID=7936 RepID=A0A0E9TGC3_ANGAN
MRELYLCAATQSYPHRKKTLDIYIF